MFSCSLFSFSRSDAVLASKGTVQSGAEQLPPTERDWWDRTHKRLKLPPVADNGSGQETRPDPRIICFPLTASPFPRGALDKSKGSVKDKNRLGGAGGSDGVYVC